jgi:hypothetical protein
MPYCRSTSFGSLPPGTVFEDGHAMCDARRLWDLPRSCQQGDSTLLLSKPRLIFYFLKSLYAFHIEALVPSFPHTSLISQTPYWQRLNGSKGVRFFSVGRLEGRTFVIYMKKKGVGSSSIALSRSHP